MGQQDVFLNVAGGLRVDDPGLDLSVVASIISSYEDKAIDPGICFAGEIGLGGEVRAVNRIENRIAEAAKMGFKKIMLSRYAIKGLELDKYQIEVLAVSKLEEMYRHIFL